MTQIAPQPGIMEIDLYQGGAAHVAGLENVVKLSSNENLSLIHISEPTRPY